jgi:hypothetical protein
MRAGVLIVLLATQAQAASGFATFLATGATQQFYRSLASSWVLHLAARGSDAQLLCHLEGVLTGDVRQLGDGICESLD